MIRRILIILVVSLGGFVSAHATFTDNGRRIRGILENTSFTESDIKLLEEYARADEGFNGALKSIKNGQPASIQEIEDAYEGLVRLIRKEGREDSDEYRFALRTSAIVYSMSMRYEKFMDCFGELKSNVSKYVNDKEKRRQWYLLTEWLYTDDLRIRWDGQDSLNTLLDIYNYLENNPIDSEVMYVLGSTLIESANSFMVTADGIDKISLLSTKNRRG